MNAADNEDRHGLVGVAEIGPGELNSAVPMGDRKHQLDTLCRAYTCEVVNSRHSLRTLDTLYTQEESTLLKLLLLPLLAAKHSRRKKRGHRKQVVVQAP